MSPTEEQTWVNVVSISNFLKGCHIENEKTYSLYSLRVELIPTPHSRHHSPFPDLTA